MAVKAALNKFSYLPWIVGFGLLIENIDVLIINTAIPQMAHTLATEPITLKIGITSYLLTLAACIPISGYIADRFGSKTIFAWAMIVFLLGSVLCGFADHVWQLVVGRLVQGAGGSMMAPVGRLILLRAFPREQFVKAFSALTLLGQMGVAIGPVLGGALVKFFSWRFVFFVNLPIGIIALLLIYFWVENTRAAVIPKFDFYGFSLFGIGIGLVIFSFSMLAEQASETVVALLLLSMGSIILSVFSYHCYKTPEPSLAIDLFKIRTFKIAVLGSFLIRIGMGGLPFLLPLLFQLGWGQNALQSGLWLLPYGLAMLIAKPLVGRILSYWGFRKLLILTPFVISLILLSFSLILYHYSFALMLIIVSLLGFFSSLQFTFMNILNFVDITAENTAKATSVASVFQQVAMSFGICTAAFLLILFNKTLIGVTIKVAAFHYTLIGLAVIVLLPVLLFRQLKSIDGQLI